MKSEEIKIMTSIMNGFRDIEGENKRMEGKEREREKSKEKRGQ